MAADPLDSLHRLRQMEVDEARRALADCHAAERAASDTLDQADRALVDEAAAATRLQADDAAVEAFAAWLPVGRASREEAGEALAMAQSRTAEARAALALNRAALRAVELLIEERDAEQRAEALRREQHRLDEIGGRTLPAAD